MVIEAQTIAITTYTGLPRSLLLCFLLVFAKILDGILIQGLAVKKSVVVELPSRHNRNYHIIIIIIIIIVSAKKLEAISKNYVQHVSNNKLISNSYATLDKIYCQCCAISLLILRLGVLLEVSFGRGSCAFFFFLSYGLLVRSLTDATPVVLLTNEGNLYWSFRRMGRH